MPVTLFLSTDSGAKVLHGHSATNDLLHLLNSVLITNTVFKFNGNTLAFTDITANVMGDTSSTGIFPQPASGDIVYFGGQAKFSQVNVQMAQVIIGGSIAWEYWNGSAWTALVSPTDGTSALTANGRITWSAAAQTGWIANSVNSTTLFWVRARATAAISQNVNLTYASIYGWYSPYTGTNVRTYRSTLTSGVQHWFTINDNAPTTDAKDATIWGNETDPGSTQTAPTVSPQTFPTSVQLSTGAYIRKSNTADDTTARSWLIVADEKSCHLLFLTGDTANTYRTHSFGEYFSFVNGDLYRSYVCASITKAAGSNAQGIVGLGLRNRSDQSIIVITAAGCGIWTARNFTGAGAAVQGAIGTGLPSCMNGIAQLGGGGAGCVQFPNGSDGGLMIAPLFFFDTTTNCRGRLRGLWDWGHAYTAVNDGDPIPGNSLLSSKTFRVLKLIAMTDGGAGISNSGNGVMLVETSDTWETN